MGTLQEKLDNIKKVCFNLCWNSPTWSIFVNAHLEITKQKTHFTSTIVAGTIYYIDRKNIKTKFYIPHVDTDTLLYQLWKRYKNELPWPTQTFEDFLYKLEHSELSEFEEDKFNELADKCLKKCVYEEIDYKMELLKKHHLKCN